MLIILYYLQNNFIALKTINKKNSKLFIYKIYNMKGNLNNIGTFQMIIKI